ncbi:hypothetical protein [Hahella ganghwensis]|uniref:hypothetical protein n=1 Tax=Hahella ganghwensis TaxID=286420 RepID=UPI00036854F9|nr:hypothetical protein [Hahella ganghwensis]
MSARKKYIEEMKTKLDQWDKDIDELEKRARTASSELKAEYQNQVKTLKDKRDEAAKKFEELQSATDGAWEDVKDGMEQAWNSVSHAFGSAKTKIFGKEKEEVK